MIMEWITGNRFHDEHVVFGIVSELVLMVGVAGVLMVLAYRWRWTTAS